MSGTISVPANPRLGGFHLGRERSHAGTGQVNDGRARAGGGRGGLGGGEEKRPQKQITAVGGVLRISLCSHHSTIANNES